MGGWFLRDIQILLYILACPVYCDLSTFRENLSRPNSSNLCKRMPSQSCVHQLQYGDHELDLEACQVTVANNSHKHCNLDPWDFEHFCDSHDSCGVQLEVYRHTFLNLPITRTAFNLSITNTTENNISFRYRDLYSENFSFCMNFTLGNKVTYLGSLWYDCLFHVRDYEGQPFLLEFLVGKKYGQFVFRVPKDKDLANGEGFVYIHLSHNFQITITFQAILEDDETQDYIISVCKWSSESCIIYVNATVNLNDTSTFSFRWRNLITVSIPVYLPGGNYSVHVDGDDCGKSGHCYRAVSPFFVIYDDSSSYILPVSLTLAVLITILVTVVLFYQYSRRNKPSFDVTATTVLLVHDPKSTDSKLVNSIRIFLEQCAGFCTWFDIIDIPKSDHRDPLRWYSSAMKRADFVVIVVPDSTSPANYDSIYHHTYDLALELLANRISLFLSGRLQHSLRRCVVFETGHASKIPAVCLSMKRFSVPDDLITFIHYVQKLHGTVVDKSLSKKESLIIFNSIYDEMKNNAVVSVEMPLLVENHSAETLALLDIHDQENVHKNMTAKQEEKLNEEFGTFPPSVQQLPSIFGEVQYPQDDGEISLQHLKLSG